MARKKLQRFAALKTMPHVFEFPTQMRGAWRQFFGNEHPIVLELACGKAEYTVALARQCPDRNYIGMDIQGERLFVGAKKVQDLGLRNAAFVRGHILEVVNYFAPHEIAEIWITFPDPFPKESQERKRLTSPRFLELYQHILKSKGRVHLKTDSRELFEYSLETVTRAGGTVISAVTDIDAATNMGLPAALSISTAFEQKQRAARKPIHYLAFALPSL